MGLHTNCSIVSKCTEGTLRLIIIYSDVLLSHIITISFVIWNCRIKSKGGPSSEKAEVVVDPMAIFLQALENCKPIIGTTGVRRGGKLYHVSTLII